MNRKIAWLAGSGWLAVCALCADDVVKQPAATAHLQEQKHVLKLLSGISPKPGEPKENVRMVDGHYVLWGEVFEQGRVVALVEMNRQNGFQNDTLRGLALALWNSGSWQLEQVVDVPIFWKAPSISKDKVQFLPDGLPDKAFWLRRLGPAQHAMLVVSAPHSRYRSGHFVLEYDPDSHQLTPSPHFSVGEPSWRDGYVVFTDDSGNKARWTEELFYQFKGPRLKFRGALRMGSLRGDDSIIHVAFPGAGKAQDTQTRWRFVSTDEDQSVYRVYVGEEQDTEPPPLGEVHFLSFETFEDRGPHLFHNLTDIPASVASRERWAEGRRVFAPGAAIADREVQVKGDAALVRALGPKQKK